MASETDQSAGVRHTIAAKRAVRDGDVAKFIRALLGWLYEVTS